MDVVLARRVQSGKPEVKPFEVYNGVMVRSVSDGINEVLDTRLTQKSPSSKWKWGIVTRGMAIKVGSRHGVALNVVKSSAVFGGAMCVLVHRESVTVTLPS